MSTLCKTIIDYIYAVFYDLFSIIKFEFQPEFSVFSDGNIQLFGLLLLIVIGVCVVFSILNLLANIIRLKG